MFCWVLACFDMLLSDPDWIQTNDLLLRRQLLYSAELPGRNCLKRPENCSKRLETSRWDAKIVNFFGIGMLNVISFVAFDDRE